MAEYDFENPVREEEQALLPGSSKTRGRGVRTASLLCASLLVASCGFAWSRGEQRISTRGVIGKSESACATNGQDCSASKCCADPASTCFKKNDHWASCNATCNQHYKWENNGWADKGEEKVWDCDVLSEVPTAEEGPAEDACVADGQNCSLSKCCSNPSSTCFQKNDEWASCNATCNAHYKWESNGWVDKGEEQVWDCTVLSEEQESECAQDGQDCSESKCCASAGKQCFRKSEWWATCNETCNKKSVWENNGWVEKDEDMWDCTLISEESESPCVADGQDCSASKCCTDPKSTCFKKNDGWASCNTTCNHHYMWENNGWADKGDEKVWECDVLSEVPTGEEGPVEDACVADGQNCALSKCCSNPSSTCFQKNDEWASCNATCNAHYKWEGNGWVDKGEEQVWDCTVLSEEQESECAQDGQDCSESKCCASAGKQCFRKSEWWATCNETCNKKSVWENNGWVEKDEDMWECTLLSEESESACVADGQDCSASQCCSNADSHCFKKNDGWASCNATCNQHYMWENNGWADKGEEKVWDCEILSEGGDSEDNDCAVDGQDCSKSKCCVSEGKTCFQKNEYWATCNETCNHNYVWENNGWADKGDEKIWDCVALGK